MQISSIGASQSFGKVFAVAGNKEKMNKLKKVVSQCEGKAEVFDATDVYKKSKTLDGKCVQAAKRGKQVGFVVTGTKDLEKVSFMETGWTSIGGISQHIEKFINLHNVNQDVKPIKNAMKKDI